MTRLLEFTDEERAKASAVVAPLAVEFVLKHAQATDEEFVFALSEWIEALRAGSIEENGVFAPSDKLIGQEFLRAAVLQWNAMAGTLGTA